jgi:hypothetical protein
MHENMAWCNFAYVMSNKFLWYLGLAAGVFLSIATVFLFAVVVALRPERFWDFVDGKAADWVQAGGAILAIVGAYQFGQLAHNQQIKREKYREECIKLERIRSLKAFFKQARRLDATVFNLCAQEFHPALWSQISSLANNQIEDGRTIPIFELPGHELVSHLACAREAAIFYKDFSEAFLREKGAEAETIKAHMLGVAAKGMSVRREAAQYCDKLAAVVEDRVKKLS